MDAKEKRRLELEAKRKKVEDMRRRRAENQASAGGSEKPAAVAAATATPHKPTVDKTLDDVTSLLGDLNISVAKPAAEEPKPQAVEAPTAAPAAQAPRPTATLSVASIGICAIPPKQPEVYTKEVQTDEIEPEEDEADEEMPAAQETTQTPVVEDTQADAEPEAAPQVREMSAVEAKEVMGSAEFMDFLSDSSRVMERALGQANTYDIMVDYTIADDQVKETDGVSLQASFFDERWAAERAVTDIAFHPTHPEAFYAAYNARGDGSTQDPDGVVLMWSAAMRQRPEYTFHCQSAVLAIATTEFAPTVVVGTTYSGQVVMWDTRAKSTPVQRSALSSNAHTYPVYSVAVVGTQNAHNLITISNNGRVCSWEMNKLVQPKETLDLKSKLSGAKATAKEVEVAATCLATSAEEFNQFFVGSEDGTVCDCLRHGAKAGVNERFLGHFGPVTGIDLHSSKGAMDFSDLLLTSSADWTIKLWSKKNPPDPIYTFEGGSDYIYDAKWSPVHPAVFASVDGTGSLDLWHLNEDSEMPRYKIQVSEHAMNRLRWSKDGRRIVTGTTHGHVYLYDVAQEVAVPSDGEWQRFDETLAELRDSGERASMAQAARQ